MKIFVKLMLCGVFAAMSLLAAAAPPKGWMTDLQAARAQSRQTKKPIMVIISGTEWCGPCRSLQKSVVTAKKFERFVAKHAIPLYIDLPRAAKKDWGKRTKPFKFYKGGVPCYAVVDADLKVLSTPKSRTVYDFMQAICDGSAKLGNDKIKPTEKPDKKSKKDKKDKKDKKNKKSKKSKKK